MSWAADAACRGPENNHLFFPTDGSGTRAARLMCKDCPVQKDCLDFAIENQIWHGIWGGRSGEERRKLAAGEELPPGPGGPGRKQTTYTDCLWPGDPLCGTRSGYLKGCRWQDCIACEREYSARQRVKKKEREAHDQEARDLSHR